MKCVVCGIKGTELYGQGCRSVGRHTVCNKCATRIIEQHIDFHELGD